MAKRINSMNIAAVEYFDDASMIMGIVFGYGVGLLVLARCLRERLCSQSFKQTRLRRACLVSAGAAQGGPKPPRRRHCSKAPAALYFPAFASGVVGKKSGNDDGPCTQPPGVCEHACSRARRGGLWRHGGLEGLRVRGAGGCLAVARVGDAGSGAGFEAVAALTCHFEHVAETCPLPRGLPCVIGGTFPDARVLARGCSGFAQSDARSDVN